MMIHNKAMAGRVLHLGRLVIQFDHDGNSQEIPSWATGDVEKFLLSYHEPRSTVTPYVDPATAPPDYRDPPAARAVERDVLIDPERPTAGFKRALTPGHPAGTHAPDRIGTELQYLRDDAKE